MARRAAKSSPADLLLQSANNEYGRELVAIFTESLYENNLQVNFYDRNMQGPIDAFRVDVKDPDLLQKAEELIVKHLKDQMVAKW